MLKEYGGTEEENGIPQAPCCIKTSGSNEECADEDDEKYLCEECFSNDKTCISGHYFVKSEIDSEYTEPQNEQLTYHPIHILVQCQRFWIPSSVPSFKKKRRSFTDFLKNKLRLPENHLVHPFYRQHSRGKIPDLQKSELTGSDFSHSNFKNSC